MSTTSEAQVTVMLVPLASRLASMTTVVDCWVLPKLVDCLHMPKQAVSACFHTG